MSKELNKFDERIKALLEDIQPDYDPASWESLEEQWEVSQDMELDDTVRSRMESMDVPYEVASWTALQDKMTAAEDIELDDTVRESVEQEAEGYSSSSWSALLSRLEAWERVRREFWMLRAAEGLMLLLLLLALYQYGPQLPQIVTEGDQPTAAEISKPHTDHDQSRTSKIKPNVENTGKVASVGQAFDMASEVSDEASSPGYSVTSGSGQRMVSVPPRLPSSVLGVNEIKTAAANSDKSGIAYVGDLKKAISGVRNSDEKFEVSSLGQSVISLLDQDSRKNIDVAVPVIEHPDRAIWLSMQSHAALNQVHTPEKEEFEAQNAYTLGYGLGLLVGFNHGKLTWETGAEYQFTIFKPKRTKLTGNISDGYRTTTLSEVNLDYINIPLQARYLILEKGRHELYAMGGVMLHISSKVDFDFIEERDEDNRFPVDFNSQPEPEDIIGVQSGRFTYFSVNAGLGYQFVMNTRTKLFAQPSYEHFAEREGIMNLNGEKVNTLRLDFGVRVRL
ncbi:MAG: hypothetical protein R3275_10730 [Saprospiraceae bacterium]|nr:hypothetical protein [Saprospiraceae bacterium]